MSNVVFQNPLQPSVPVPLNNLTPQERIFEATVGAQNFGDPTTDTSDPDTYAHLVRAMINDAQSFEDEVLGPAREELLEYFYGDKPAVENVDDDGVALSSTVVSTDVRDTVMGIIPSLIRIFSAPEHIVFFSPNHAGQEELAKQMSDYCEYVFWEDNDGLTLLHSALKDALTTKTAVVRWYSDTSEEYTTQTFNNITSEQLQTLIFENDTIEILSMTESEMVPGFIEEVVVRWEVQKPVIEIRGVPLDEFRVNREATCVDDATLIGFDTIVRKSWLISQGYDPEIIEQYTGATRPFSPDRVFRNVGLDDQNILSDLEVEYGEYFIRIDRDGDGVEELRKICVIGSDQYILDDREVSYVPYAVGCPDPRPHTLIGDCPADLVIDIQRIKTNMLRGSLDSLAQSIWPRTVFNEFMVNVDDVLNEEIGAAIRTKGDPAATVMSLNHTFVGQPVFEMFDTMERLRQVRTGISDASKGLDPKALQSTSLTGVDAIISGAQERIELIARLLANSLLKPLFKGLMREMTDHQNQQRTVQLRGQWVTVNPSTYDPSMKVSVNPTLGKGSDISRMMALQEVKNTQIMIMEKFGVSNPAVGPQEFMNTVEDLVAIANIKNVSRYFKKLTPEIMAQIEQAPKEPDPTLLLAQAEMEKRRTEMVKAMADQEFDEMKLRMDDNFKRDQLYLTSLLSAAQIEAEYTQMEIDEANLREEAHSVDEE